MHCLLSDDAAANQLHMDLGPDIKYPARGLPDIHDLRSEDRLPLGSWRISLVCGWQRQSVNAIRVLHEFCHSLAGFAAAAEDSAEHRAADQHSQWPERDH